MHCFTWFSAELSGTAQKIKLYNVFDYIKFKKFYITERLTMLGDLIQKSAERRIGAVDGLGYLVKNVVRTSVGGYREVAMLELNNTTIWRETAHSGVFDDSNVAERYLVFVGHEEYTEGCEERDLAPPSCVPAHDTWYVPAVFALRTWYAVFTDHSDALAYAKKFDF